MARRVIGVVIALISLASYGMHIAKAGSRPHDLWALAAGIAFLFGLWLALLGPRRVECKIECLLEFELSEVLIW